QHPGPAVTVTGLPATGRSVPATANQLRPMAIRRRHLRKEDSCPSLLHLVRIQVLPPRRAHPPTAPFRRCHTRPPTRTRTDPPRPADGARPWHHCARCCAEPRQAPLNPKLRLVRQVIQGLTWHSVGLAGRCSGYFRVSGGGEVP